MKISEKKDLFIKKIKEVGFKKKYGVKDTFEKQCKDYSIKWIIKGKTAQSYITDENGKFIEYHKEPLQFKNMIIIENGKPCFRK
jgi:5'(3')-deoxyribonucleotidase